MMTYYSKIINVTTVKPLYRAPSSNWFYFASKTCSRVLGYSAVYPKVCQEAGGEGRKSLKAIC